MNRINPRARSATVITLSLLIVVTTNLQSAVSPVGELLTTSHRDFCAIVQRQLADTTLPLTNKIHVSKNAFTESKARVQPTETHQFLDTDANGRLIGISCKTKSADHLRAVHGTPAARDPALPPRSCRDVHRAMVVQLWASFNENERASSAFAPHRVMLDTDTQSYTGSGWLGSPAEAYLSGDGRLHLRASALLAEWEDWRWKIMPKSFRGNHYCHLVAPERIRALMRAEESLRR
ncbi:MAG: hypothetical protein FJ196_00825 [Gammaproteobacteria bacterium]|nr:hypothetical protein [Gammaproteobacteria bacterium]